MTTQEPLCYGTIIFTLYTSACSGSIPGRNLFNLCPAASVPLSLLDRTICNPFGYFQTRSLLEVGDHRRSVPNVSNLGVAILDLVLIHSPARIVRCAR